MLQTNVRTWADKKLISEYKALYHLFNVAGVKDQNMKIRMLRIKEELKERGFDISSRAEVVLRG